MGRPKGSKNKKTIEKEKALNELNGLSETLPQAVLPVDKQVSNAETLEAVGE